MGNNKRRRSSHTKKSSSVSTNSTSTSTSAQNCHGSGPVVVDFATTYSKVIQYEQNRNRSRITTNSNRANTNTQTQTTWSSSTRGRHPPAAHVLSNSAAAAGVLELRDVRKEVETLGAGGLDRKSVLQWKDKQYQDLGGKGVLKKKPRMSAKIGLGIAKKNKEREQKAKELARETGMLIPGKKTSSKSSKKRRKKQ